VPSAIDRNTHLAATGSADDGIVRDTVHISAGIPIRLRIIDRAISVFHSDENNHQ
jgi:hypothetical protein